MMWPRINRRGTQILINKLVAWAIPIIFLLIILLSVFGPSKLADSWRYIANKTLWKQAAPEPVKPGPTAPKVDCSKFSSYNTCFDHMKDYCIPIIDKSLGFRRCDHCSGNVFSCSDIKYDGFVCKNDPCGMDCKWVNGWYYTGGYFSAFSFQEICRDNPGIKELRVDLQRNDFDTGKIDFGKGEDVKLKKRTVYYITYTIDNHDWLVIGIKKSKYTGKNYVYIKKDDKYYAYDNAGNIVQDREKIAEKVIANYDSKTQID